MEPGRGGKRVVRERAGIRSDKAIIEACTRRHRGLGEVGHAVHGVGDAHAMPVQARVRTELVDQANSDLLAAFDPQHGAWRGAVVTGKARSVASYRDETSA